MSLEWSEVFAWKSKHKLFHKAAPIKCIYSKYTNSDCIHLVGDEEHLKNGDLRGMGKPSL